MKTNTLLAGLTVTAALVGGLFGTVQAANTPEGFIFRDGQVWTWQNDKPTLLTEDVKLPNNIAVGTNGTFKVGTHAPRTFQEGQILTRDGMLTSPNGKIEPIMDHVSLDAGKTVSSVNGQKMAVQQDIPLGPDKRLTPDRVLIGGERGWMRVLDGQLFSPNGNVIPAVDTITLNRGKVLVQKDGSQLVVPPGRSIMMNEGTKVFGDGRVMRKDGTVTQLTEGQIINLEGVVKHR